MLLVIDIGNTNTVLGLYVNESLQRTWRVTTDKTRTVDEYTVLVHNLFGIAELKFSNVTAVVISSVVPAVSSLFERLCHDYLQAKVLVVDSTIRSGMKILYDNPSEVGADRIVNAVAAYEKYRCSLIVIDFGTATTFDCINSCGDYLGGAISPGIGISAEALFERTSKLPRVPFPAPPAVIAKNTVHSMQSGIIFGYAGLVDGIVQRMLEEGCEDALVVATGGLAPVIAPFTTSIKEIDTDLTLNGLRILYQRNIEEAF